MKKLLTDLKEQGCNVEKALERFCYDEELYEQCYVKLMSNEEFGRLSKQITEKNKEEALKITHSLKGMLANMELLSLRTAVLKVEEQVKSEEWQEGMLRYAELMNLKSEYDNILQR